MINKDTGIAVNEWEPTRDGMTISVVTKRLGEIEEKVQGLVFSCVEVRNHAWTATPRRYQLVAHNVMAAPVPPVPRGATEARSSRRCQRASPTRQPQRDTKEQGTTRVRLCGAAESISFAPPSGKCPAEHSRRTNSSKSAASADRSNQRGCATGKATAQWEGGALCMCMTSLVHLFSFTTGTTGGSRTWAVPGTECAARLLPC